MMQLKDNGVWTEKEAVQVIRTGKILSYFEDRVNRMSGLVRYRMGDEKESIELHQCS